MGFLSNNIVDFYTRWVTLLLVCLIDYPYEQYAVDLCPCTSWIITCWLDSIVSMLVLTWKLLLPLCCLDCRYFESRLSQEGRKRIYFFNSLFFTKLLGTAAHPSTLIGVTKGNYEQVRKWTGEVNLFDKAYILIPILRRWYSYYHVLYFKCKLLVSWILLVFTVCF